MWSGDQFLDVSGTTTPREATSPRMAAAAISALSSTSTLALDGGQALGPVLAGEIVALTRSYGLIWR
jgi:hypothetical protein